MPPLNQREAALEAARDRAWASYCQTHDVCQDDPSLTALIEQVWADGYAIAWLQAHP